MSSHGLAIGTCHWTWVWQAQRTGEKVLVFCQWEDLKKHIAETLQTMGVAHLQLTGNIYQRSDILRRFQDIAENDWSEKDECSAWDCEDETQDGERVLLLSLEHAASGTNLTAANHALQLQNASLHPKFEYILIHSNLVIQYQDLFRLTTTCSGGLCSPHARDLGRACRGIWSAGHCAVQTLWAGKNWTSAADTAVHTLVRHVMQHKGTSIRTRTFKIQKNANSSWLFLAYLFAISSFRDKAAKGIQLTWCDRHCQTSWVRSIAGALCPGEQLRMGKLTNHWQSFSLPQGHEGPRQSSHYTMLRESRACRRPSRQRIKEICGRIMCVKTRRNGRERPLLQVVDDWPALTGSANMGRLGLKLKFAYCVREAYQEQGESRRSKSN